MRAAAEAGLAQGKVPHGGARPQLTRALSETRRQIEERRNAERQMQAERIRSFADGRHAHGESPRAVIFKRRPRPATAAIVPAADTGPLAPVPPTRRS